MKRMKIYKDIDNKPYVFYGDSLTQKKIPKLFKGAKYTPENNDERITCEVVNVDEYDSEFKKMTDQILNAKSSA